MTGTGIEMGLEAARLTFLGHPLEPPRDEAGVRPDDIDYYTEANGSWLRDGASLAILYVSDENDLSPYPVDAYVRWFNDLKGADGHRDEDLVTLSGVSFLGIGSAFWGVVAGAVASLATARRRHG